MSPRNSAVAAARTRERILDAAMTMASVDGLGGITIGTLASDLALSKAGVIGPFGTKEELQLATLARALDLFRDLVWEPAATLPPGIERLRACAENWIVYLEQRTLPGGCFVTTASTEWDSRNGPLRDMVAAGTQRWLATLRADARIAVEAGDLDPQTDPPQLAFELNGIAMSLNQSLLLFEDDSAPERARAAVARLLRPPHLP
jgi:AcrR family transcriptional regulator